MVNDIPADCSGVNGVAHQSAAPSAVALRTPPKNPSQVLFGTHAPGNFVLPDQFAPHKLQDVAHLIHDHQIEQQPRILPFEARNLQQQQCRRVAQAIRAYHDPKLNFGGAFQKCAVSPAIAMLCGNENERQHGNHDGEEAVPLDADEVSTAAA